MNFLPKRKKHARMLHKDETVVRCDAHLQFVRGFVCSVWHVSGPSDPCSGKVEAAHVRTGTDGGTGMKPSDSWAIPLCNEHHREQHQIGEPAFERKYGIKMKEIAAGLWDKSKPGLRYRTTHTPEVK
jgi:hypothetical protein